MYISNVDKYYQIALYTGSNNLPVMSESALRHLNFPCLSRKYFFAFGTPGATPKDAYLKTAAVWNRPQRSGNIL